MSTWKPNRDAAPDPPLTTKHHDGKQDPMELPEYQRMYELEDHHWWFQSRLALVERVLARHAPVGTGKSPRMLDVGCGTGMFLERESADRISFGLDFSREALGFARRRGAARLVCADSQVIPFADERFDLVTAFDLIEHVDRDQALVNEVHRILRPGGVFLATVPAHPYLWSSHDDALHHKRRYRRPEFEALFDAERWLSERMTYSFSMIYPAAAVVRTARRLAGRGGDSSADTNLTPPWINHFMLALHRIETAWIARFDSPFGLSLMTVRRKRPGSL